MTQHRGVSGLAPAVPNLTEAQLAGHTCVWCHNHARDRDRPLVAVRGVRNPWGGRLAAHGGRPVSCLDWVRPEWLLRHPDVRKASR